PPAAAPSRPTAPPPPPPAAAPAAPKQPAAPTTPPPPPPSSQKATPSPVPPPPSGAKQPPAPATTPAPTAPPTAAPPPGGGTTTAPPPRPGAPTTPPSAGAPTTTPTTPPGRPGAPTTPPSAGAPTTAPTTAPPGRPGAPPAAAPSAGTPVAPGATPPTAAPTAPGGAATTAPTAVPGAPNATPPAGRAQNAPPTVAPAFRQAPQVTTALPPPPPPQEGLRVIAPGAAPSGPRRLDDFRGQRRESQQGGRTIITEPGRIIIRDPGGQQYVRHSEVDRFRYGARDIQTQTVGGETRTVVIRPDGTQVITVTGRDGQLMRRIRRDQRGREIIIIDNSYRGPRGGDGGFFVALAPPVVRIPYNRYIVDSEEASPDLLYETMMAPPVERIERRYSLDEIRYSPTVRQRMPSIDVNTINFELGSWEVPPDQAAKLQAIADGLNRAIQENPRAVFLIEGHTDAVGNDVDNLSLSDRRAESAATLLTQQFNVPAENLTSQGYGEQYLKEQIDGPSPINRRVTIRNITPLLNGGQASLPPPPPGTAPPRR
ncbi:OmpA family protein, partial [Bradyrhizobium sp. 190]|uniref:OmpA family protein n=1 Tax=Bradyrhizobium sp. 190 TaxID=2782658 RepID=UPI001FFA4A55